MQINQENQLTLTNIESVIEKSPSISFSLSLHDNLTGRSMSWGFMFPTCSQVLHGPDTLRTLVEVEDLVTRINRSKICIGNPDSRFLAVLERRKGVIMGKSGTCICGYAVNACTIIIIYVYVILAWLFLPYKMYFYCLCCLNYRYQACCSCR